MPKSNELLAEIQELAEHYIGCLKTGGADVEGTEFAVDNDDQIRIWQYVDEDDEPDKFYVLSDDIAADTWNTLVALIAEHNK